MESTSTSSTLQVDEEQSCDESPDLKSRRRHDARNEARRQKIAAESPDAKRRRLDAAKAAFARRRAAESPDTKRRRLDAAKAAFARRKAAESPDTKRRRLDAAKAAFARRNAAESPDTKRRRLDTAKAALARRKAAESPDSKRSRLDARNAASAQKRTAGRLAAQRAARAKQRAARSSLASQSTPDSKRRRLDARNAASTQKRTAGRLAAQRAARAKQRAARSSLASQSKLGVVDVQQFDEGTYQPDDIRHELTSLFTADHVCSHCKALRWREERIGFCCGNGQIMLPALPPPPNEIANLYANNDFLINIRSYNNALSLASLGMGKEIIQPGFSPTVTVMGKLYHLMGSLLPQTNTPPKFAQIYFTDTTNETTNRLRANPHLDAELLASLQACLRNVNPYIKTFKAAIEMRPQSSDVRIVINATKRPAGEHARCFNLPTGSEVAVLMPGGETSTNNMDVVIHTRSGAMQRINTMHRSYDALHYVLLYPGGEDGYHLDRWKTNKKRVCLMLHVKSLYF